MSTMNEEEIQGLEALLYLNKLSEVEVPINELLDGWRLLTDRRKRLVLMSAQVAHVLFSEKSQKTFSEEFEWSLMGLPG